VQHICSDELGPQAQPVPHLTAAHVRAMRSCLENRLRPGSDLAADACCGMQMVLKACDDYHARELPLEVAKVLVHGIHFGGCVPVEQDCFGDVWYDRTWLAFHNDAVAVVCTAANIPCYIWDTIVLPGPEAQWTLNADARAQQLFAQYAVDNR
jgi:hypothetical protein